MSLNQRITTEFSPCTPSAPQFRDLSIQTFRPVDLDVQVPRDFILQCLDGVKIYMSARRQS